MLIKKGLLRGGIPFFIMEIVALILYFQGVNGLSKDFFYNGLIALVIGATTVIYNFDDWSLVKQSIIHFSIMLVTVFPILLLSGWFPMASIQDASKIFGIFALSGLVIWTIMFTLAKIFKW